MGYQNARNVRRINDAERTATQTSHCTHTEAIVHTDDSLDNKLRDIALGAVAAGQPRPPGFLELS